MKYKFSKFDEMFRQWAECRRFLHPIQLMQEAVYGKSYLNEGFHYLPNNEGDLGEEFAAKLYKAKIDRQAGHDLVLKDGETIEVRFRRLHQDSSSSGWQTCIDKLNNKTANRLFVLVYNPITEALDEFEYNRREYGERVTIRWSCRNGDYTDNGGRRNRINLPPSDELCAGVRKN